MAASSDTAKEKTSRLRITDAARAFGRLRIDSLDPLNLQSIESVEPAVLQKKHFAGHAIDE
jgi:hypothetical protein